jgi:sugar phosphate isomerase/epimerase
VSDIISPVLEKVFVNVPFTMLQATYLDFVVENRVNPEIGLDAEALDTVPDAVFAGCADRLGKGGASLTFHGPFFDLSPGSADPEIRAVTRRRFEQVLRLVPLFHPKAVVCHPGYEKCRYGYVRASWMEKSAEMWHWFSGRLNELGSRLVLENVYEQAPEELLPLFEALAPQGVGFCLDVGHQAAFGRVPLGAWLDVLGPYLRHVHLHDNHGDADAHLGLGNGSVDLPLLFEYLRKRVEMRPLITLEPHLPEDLWPSLSYLEANWPWQN